MLTAYFGWEIGNISFNTLVSGLLINPPVVFIRAALYVCNPFELDPLNVVKNCDFMIRWCENDLRNNKIVRGLSWYLLKLLHYNQLSGRRGFVQEKWIWFLTTTLKCRHRLFMVVLLTSKDQRKKDVWWFIIFWILLMRIHKIAVP